MASIKKDLKTGTYYFILDLPRDPVSGKRRQAKRRGYKNKKEAQAAAASLLHELTVGTFVKEKDISFSDFAATWLDYYEKVGNVKVSSVRVREKEVNVWKRYFNTVAISKISKKMYQDAILAMKKDLSDSTISGVHGCGKMIFKRALEHDLIKFDPTQFAKLPRTETTVEDIENRSALPKYLEKEELALLLKTAKDKGLEGDYETLLTLAYTGMRIGEFVVLRESDLNVKENTISVTKTYYNPTNNMAKYSLLTPKTKKSNRVIEVDEMVTAALQDRIKRNKEFKMLYRQTYYDKGYISPNLDTHPGYPNTVKQFNNRFRRLLKLAGLPTTLSVHSLRHTHTSLLAEIEIPIQEIMDRLGHKDDDTTKNVYLHVTKTRKKEASQKFGELMRNL